MAASSISIAQALTTRPGSVYELSVSFSPRPTVADNRIGFTGSDWQALQAPVPLKGIVITSNKVWGISNDKRVFLVDI